MDKQSFFNLTLEEAMKHAPPNMPSLEDIYNTWVTKERKASIFEYGMTHAWIEFCYRASGAEKACRKWHDHFKYAYSEAGPVWRFRAEAHDTLQLFKDNNILGSWLWRDALGNSTIAKMIEMKVPMRPYAAGPDEPDVWWDRHFIHITDYFRTVRRAHHAKRQAFSKLYYRCFAKAFKNPEGKARKRENQAAEDAWEEAVSKVARVG